MTDTDQPTKHWNMVVLGDGTPAHLVPRSSWARIVNPDGTLFCNHADTWACGFNGHETVELYEVVRLPAVPMAVMLDAEVAADVKIGAAVDLIGRTGARSVRVGFVNDEEPTVWFAVASYSQGRWETAAGHNATVALLRLCERLIDGGTCAHCAKPSMFHGDLDDTPTILDPLFCAYEWDPELATFRRGCEGAER